MGVNKSLTSTGKSLIKGSGSGVGKIAGKLNPILALKDSLDTMINAVKDYAVVYEQEETKRDAIRANLDKSLADIKRKKDIALKYLDKTFDENDKILEKQFEIIDKALSSDDININALQVSLAGIIDIVKLSPIADIAKLEQQLDDPNEIIDV